MPTKKLTDLFVERVKPPPRGRVEYFDAVFGSLALRVTETGHKSWSLYYRMGKRLRRFTIGNYPAIKPAQARREASAALERVRQGIDPSEEKRQRRLTDPPEADTFESALQDYLDRARRNMAPNTFKEAKRVLEREFLPSWRSRPIGGLTRGDVNRVIDAIAARGAEVQANRALAHIRAFFNWTVERGRIAVSPVAGMKPPTKERPRDRVLSDDEIRWLWEACGVVGWPFGPLVKLLILTAQRRDEVGGIERPELDLEKQIWTMPRGKAKNDRVHEVQLSTAAMDILSTVPRVGDGFVFTSTGTTPVSGFSRAKSRLDAEMVKARRRSLGLPEDNKAYREAIGLALDKPLPVEIPHWILHDLRRTAATGMARLNFPPHVVDKVLNHVSGTIRGVAAVYNRFEYLEERRAALETWGRYISNLVAPVPANVVALRA
ncbi:MAG TPA: integrase arm-type DNA-binding domain-containing protein [Stellaceae bacterium]|nr:integrase arm-type DNA-binding domain-containing protein [Stellaceae bacterium]